MEENNKRQMPDSNARVGRLYKNTLMIGKSRKLINISSF
jgi:hypothetical protein